MASPEKTDINVADINKGIWIEGSVSKGIKKFLNRLLTDKNLEAVLMPAKNKTNDSYAWFLMGKDGLTESATPFPPIISVQGAKVVSYLTKKGGPWKKTAVLLRPCELRATIELAKLKQVDLNGLVLISFDCPGAYPFEKYFNEDQKTLDSEFELCIGTQSEPEGLRTVCSICTGFTGRGADIEINITGGESKGFWFVPGTDQGRQLIEKVFKNNDYNSLDSRGVLLAERLGQRREKRDTILDSFRETVKGPENLMNVLSSCINCHNCSRVCPICFCRECYFDSRALISEADDMLIRAKRKKGLRLLPDLLLFHMGRMTHMSISCVSCGACEDACPANIPVSMLFSLAGKNTQKIFNYEPGRSVDEPVPYSVFKFEELEDFEVPYTKEYSTADKEQ